MPARERQGVPYKPARHTDWKRSSQGSERNNLKTPKKASKGSLTPNPRHSKKEGCRIFVGNLPPDIKEDEIVHVFKDFGVKAVRKCQKSTFKSFAFLDLVSPEAVRLAIQQLNRNTMFGRTMTVAIPETKKSPEPAKNGDGNGKMPDLEPIPFEELGLNRALIPKAGIQTLPKPRVCFAVPLEMRGSFLLQMLKDCFRSMDWLVSIPKVLGKVTLLVMDSLPQTPYFWAICLTEERHQNMQKLFTVLAEVESRAPFLAEWEIQRGTRCMGECVIGEEGKAWNRCWVLDKEEDWAIVFFVDFGFSTTVPLNALRKLDGDEFWAIKPLAQPFMLQEEVLPAQSMMRQILEGWVTGPSPTQPHIVKIVLTAD
ncbi:tudor domain-containing protein 10 [Tiliqua scincoides]|uniref:tudor domain-containing protein 10 n=1 Tax=Tiliqua scincoides TaxID=71010 RepID=UPI0034624180